MFEVGFSELLLISVLALLVLGPQRLPRAASQLGHWLGRARAMARQFREQLDREVSLEELARTTPTDEPSTGATASNAPAAPAPEDTSHSAQELHRE